MDLSRFSDAELEKFAAGKAVDLSAFSDAELEKLAARPTSPEGIGEDAGRSLAAGVGRGVIGIGGMPADMGKAAQAAVDWAKSKVQGRPVEQIRAENNYAVSPETLDQFGSQALIRDATSGEGTNIPALPGLGHEPQSTAGKYARTIGEFAPGMAVGTGSLARRALTQAVAPGAGSEAAGQAAQGTAYEPYARVAGAVAGGFAPAMAARTVTPFPASAERQAAVQTLRNEGVQPTAGQATGSKGLQYFESEMGGGRAAAAMDRQGEQFTAAALRRVGESANRATPEVVDQAFTRIGQQFDGLAARNTAQLDQQFGQDITRVVSDYDALVPASQQARIVGDTIADIMQQVQAGGPTIAGPTYQAMRSRLDRAARASRNDPQLQDALYGVRNALDDAMERSISPADQAAWREARNQYRNMIALEKAATGAGSDTAMGLISPSQLRNATVVAHGRRNYARGDGDFAELARAGEAVLKPLPNSGTAGRLDARGLTSGVSSLVGGALGGSAGGGGGAMAGMLAGAVVPRAAGHIAMTRPVQALLANQLMAGRNLGVDARRAALAEALRGPSQLTGQR